jgi:hypothetical protein
LETAEYGLTYADIKDQKGGSSIYGSGYGGGRLSSSKAKVPEKDAKKSSKPL